MYLKTRANPRVIFSSISQRSVEVIAVCGCLFLYWIRDIINQAYFMPLWYDAGYVIPFVSYEDVEWDFLTTNADVVVIDAVEKTLRFWGIWKFFINVCISILVFYYGQRHFKSVRSLKKDVEEYDVCRAQLATESDRVFLLNHINDLFFDEVNLYTENENPDAVEGIRCFNAAVRRRVPAYISVDGFQSCLVFRYIPAVLFYLQTDVFRIWDDWSYGWPSESAIPGLEPGDPAFQSAAIGFFNVMGFCFQIFVLCPLSLYLLGAMVYGFLALQDRFSIPWWASLFVFLLLECVFLFRHQLRQVLVKIAGYVIGHAGGTANTEFVAIVYEPFAGINFLLPTSFVFDMFFSGKIVINWWVCMLVWMLLVVPCVVICYAVYEPRSLREVRREYWTRLFSSRRPARISTMSMEVAKEISKSHKMSTEDCKED